MTSENQSQKSFLFYSNYCHHSKRLINRIQTTNLMNELNMICIDNSQINIPNFVEVVPTIYDPMNRRVIINEELFNWIDSVLGNNNSPQINQNNPQINQNNPQINQSNLQMNQSMKNAIVNMQDITGDDSILAFQKNEMLGSGGVGSSYAFIEDTDNDNLNRNFSYLDDRDNNKLPNFTKANENSSFDSNSNNSSKNNQKQSAINSAYDKLLSDRQNEMSNSITNIRM